MKWISERDALIAQTMAFVQSVTGKKGDFHPPERPTAAPDVPVGTVTVETVAVETLAVEIKPPPVPLAPPVMIPPARTSGDFRSEMQARIANFRKHQERFEREREEYCAATLTRLRAAIRDPSLRPPAEN
ncbi:MULTISPECIES: hypothetical protein [Bradyrhizobium]|jgi:hypothetical protein|uniref:Uncharacterized protein n=1 Tax=Bradyrhizobium japonicum TaxID=375 RepID=A0A1Y2J7E2_BRAJP|nr:MULTISPECIES: hypothetical protein [Bradyrhizobium]OSJ22052.1 hypothetical protein BSZ19_46450 [Bradyrhizobium japonicum]CUU17455.1 FIG00445623 hypothetical protein CDS [Bradyrhizobium sp.]